MAVQHLKTKDNFGLLKIFADQANKTSGPNFTSKEFF